MSPRGSRAARLAGTAAVLLLVSSGPPRAEPTPGARAPAAVPLETVPLETVPPRPAGAMGGTEFAGATTGLDGPARQRAAVAEITSGNVPDFLRLLRPVTLSRELPGGRQATAVVWVTPDYLAIGSDDDFLRMPLTWPSACAVAAAFDCVPPTPRIVDAVWAQADRQLAPRPLPPGPKMRSIEYYLRHRGLIEGARGDLPPETLLAGHKKDVVLTGRLARRPNRIAIYGWHRQTGRPIQPLSTVHGARYADYSHGLRLVRRTMLIDGQPASIYDVLADPERAPLLTGEGAIPNVRRLMRLP